MDIAAAAAATNEQCRNTAYHYISRKIPLIF
jgi:hypothetical protein